MTKVVKGAGARKHAANRRHQQKDVVAGGKRDEVLKSAARATGKAKTLADKSSSPVQDGEWDPNASLGDNVNRLKDGGMTWRAIAEAASTNGHDIPWPDGGKLARARKQFLAGTEGQERPKAQRRAKRSAASDSADEGATFAETAEERLANAMAKRSVPWDADTPYDDVLQAINGKKLTFISKITGYTNEVRLVRDSKFLRIEEGQAGPYVTFVSTDGPFMSISLSRILEVN